MNLFTRFFILMACACALSCCSSHAVKPGAYVTQGEVPKAKPVSEAVSPVRDTAAQSAAQVGSIAKATRSLRLDLAEAVAEADRLRKLEAVTADQKNELWARLTDLSRRSLLLEDEANSANRLAEALTSKISELEIAARNKDRESELLQVQYKDEQAKSKASHDLANFNAEAAVEWEAKASSRGGVIKVLAWLLAVVVVVGGVLLWINSVNPLKRIPGA